MTKRAAFKQHDVTRAMRAAQAAGWQPGSYAVKIVDGEVHILPIAANAPSDDAADLERRMREAFGG